MGLWYPKDTKIELTAFVDAYHVGCQDTRRYTSRSTQSLEENLEQMENGTAELYFVKATYQLADIFMKALGRERFEFMINRLGMQSITPEKLKSLAKFEEV
ncbi:hypothetical protein Tco_1020351 [Tanacetum coccineum]|uniref:Retrovirus-related Pol polyprotein from transposon TNT 1-94 n=1 Tax=Tanacetum coccineum TaxID=301880 RepID=A0ABQ5FZS6_9ASTR